MPPQMPLPSLVDELNHRFVHGRPSNDPFEAGIFQIGWSHTFSFPIDRWNFYALRNSNAKKAEHASGSIINKGQQWAMCDLMCGAFVVDPAFVARSFLCAYPQDAATTDNAAYPGRCATTGVGWGVRQPIHVSPTLADALQTQRNLLRGRRCYFGHGWIDSCYNEILLEMSGSTGWDTNLPHAVQAVVYSRYQTAAAMGFDRWEDPACSGCEAWASEVKNEYHRFLEHFHVGEQSVPLLEFDWTRLDAPFQLAL